MINKCLVISLDAINAKDLAYVKKLPNFSQVIQQGSLATNVYPVYPSMTYCCHTSIITGTEPMRHGIFNNTVANSDAPGNEHWFWYQKDIQVPTLFELAKAQGYKTSALLWPVMAGAKIDYNIPEIWDVNGGGSLKLFWKYGSRRLLPYVIQYKHLLDGTSQPGVDNFTEAIAHRIILNKKPDFMCVHLTELDDMRHKKGIFSQEAYDILDKLDGRVGNLIATYRQSCQGVEPTIILLGDHGGADVTHVVSLNRLFADKGLLTYDEDTQQIRDWQAYANTCGGAAQVHLKDPSNQALTDKVLHLLEEQTDTIKKVYTHREAEAKYQVTGPYTWMVEGHDGYIFKNHVLPELVLPRDHKSLDIFFPKGIYYGEHGFEPEHENLRTLFMATGPGIKKGHQISDCRLSDIGVTLARVLDLQLPEPVDGQVLDIFGA